MVGVSGPTGYRIQQLTDNRLRETAKKILAKNNTNNKSVHEAINEAAVIGGVFYQEGSLYQLQLKLAIKAATYAKDGNLCSYDDFEKEMNKKRTENQNTFPKKSETKKTEQCYKELYKKLKEMQAAEMQINQPIADAKETVEAIQAEIKRQQTALQKITEDLKLATPTSTDITKLKEAKTGIEDRIKKWEKKLEDIKQQPPEKIVNPCTDDAKKVFSKVNELKNEVKKLKKSRPKEVRESLKPLDLEILKTTGKNYDPAAEENLNTLEKSIKELNDTVEKINRVREKIIDEKTAALYGKEHKDLISAFKKQTSGATDLLGITGRTRISMRQHLEQKLKIAQKELTDGKLSGDAKTKKEEEIKTIEEQVKKLKQLTTELHSLAKTGKKPTPYLGRITNYPTGGLFTYERKDDSFWTRFTNKPNWKKTEPLEYTYEETLATGEKKKRTVALQPTPEELEATALKLCNGDAKKAQKMLTRNSDGSMTLHAGNQYEKAISLLGDMQVKRGQKSAIADGTPKDATGSAVSDSVIPTTPLTPTS